MASGLYALSMEQNLEQVTNFQIDFNDTTAGRFKCLLTTASYVPNYSTHSIYSDVTNQLPATGGLCRWWRVVDFYHRSQRVGGLSLGTQRMSSGLRALLLVPLLLSL